MEFLYVLLTIIYVFACLFLGFVVLIQKGEGGGLGGAFGGGAVDVAFGAKADMTWKRATAASATLFMCLAIVLGILGQQLQQKSIAARAAEDAKKEALEESVGDDSTGTLTDEAQNPGVGDGAETGDSGASDAGSSDAGTGGSEPTDGSGE